MIEFNIVSEKREVFYVNFLPFHNFIQIQTCSLDYLANLKVMKSIEVRIVQSA